ncbi:beta-ketoacyl-[acyl-carrier-protein] synthase family protein [Planctomyces sp. SH-PL14]|uniref:beta-ketoacyl-[acyl-carrier-protein] synthase family protein n=1 Tax=Planctomyces sp. SH-PL14 TaxID=1632864 RepID=UPI00078D6A98|nr:beta-ketoacyl-[acyl-carrier-protein] synthase family protein [Planctomyces sp. SH-PL14]AMV17012.1 3-oxoacyl-[acyl-carrier-protein] synthase 2 [Planctomyces sp. SH-PL14]
MLDRPENAQRIVITGVGLAAPNGNNLTEFRSALLAGKSGVVQYETRYMGPVLAGVCNFDEFRWQKKKDRRRGTRVGSISIYCANEAVQDAGLDWAQVAKDRVGVYLGITEHGNVETENEIYEISKFGYDTKTWSHHHNPRTVANNPAGEVTINMGISGPHLTVGAACAAGNAGFIYGLQMLRLGEVDLAIAGGVSESIHTFGIFASFASQGALATHADPAKACRPFDVHRNGIVVSEGGAICTLERLPDAIRRGAKIYGEIIGYAMNSDASDFVLPLASRQAECVRMALKRAGLTPDDIDIVSSHATATEQGDIEECKALREVFGDRPSLAINNTKSFIGHAMGAAGALELMGNVPSFGDKHAHATINLGEHDPRCELRQVVANTPRKMEKVELILNNSFGMLGINSVLIVKRFPAEHGGIYA